MSVTFKSRSAYWDNIKGFLIILVVFAHCLFALQDSSLNNFLVDAIYMFHMPAFAFVSGFFSKSQNSRSFFSIMNLFVAYILLNGFFMLREIFSAGVFPSAVNPYFSAWYLLALIFWRLTVPILERIRNILPHLILISLIAGFWADINMTFAAVKIVVFYPYFMAGYLFSQEMSENIKGKKFFPRGLLLLILTICVGVFEGPLGSTVKNFSQSNFDDGKELYLNFPDEFADAVKNAGFDLVTTANNHLLDMGIEGAFRTIKILNEKQIDFVGSYSSIDDKKNNAVKILERGGLKLAILAYTYGINNYDTDKLVDENSFVSSFIVDKNSPNFAKVKAAVAEDFKFAKSFKPDLIIVLPHWGTQFSDIPDDFQRTWQKIFIDFGADIILGDHTHSVQPINFNGKNFTLFSPGNFANIYREHNGDASAMVEIYVDRSTKKIIGGAVIPLWTQSKISGNYRALPVNEIFTNEKLRGELSTNDFARAEEVLKHVTKIMLGVEINLNQQKYFFNEGGFIRVKAKPLNISEEMHGDFYNALTAAENVCFIGDSLTEGTKNGGVAWFEPLENLVRGKIFNISKGGATTKTLLERLDEMIKTGADLFVVAVGTNDIRYRDKNICAMTPEEYVATLQKLRDGIRAKIPNAKFVFIAAWTSTDGDFVSALPFGEKIKLNDAYAAALKNWCALQGEIFINPNPYIDARLKIFPQKDYLVDFIHPNADKGVELYAAAVISAK